MRMELMADQRRFAANGLDVTRDDVARRTATSLAVARTRLAPRPDATNATNAVINVTSRENCMRLRSQLYARRTEGSKLARQTQA